MPLQRAALRDRRRDFGRSMRGFVRVGLLLGVFAAAPAYAADGSVIVIPGKAGVPVIINGYDASYAVVEGEFGLDRPGHMPATIVSGPLIIPRERYYRSYFPAFGRRPGYGRREIEPPPNRRLPPPAPSYRRSWGAESMALPAATEPFEQPQINVDAMVGQDRGQGDRRMRRPDRAHRDHRDPRVYRR
jgi:hypothetical protein